MRIRSLILISALSVLMIVPATASAQASRTRVSAAEVNGTFRMNFRGKYKEMSNEIKVLALGGGKVRIALDLIYPYTLNDGEMTVNLGSLDGEASIEADTAVYRSAEFGECQITFKFVRPGTLRITQDGSDADCGFGRNVTSEGSYRKVSSKKPKFEDTRSEI